MNSLSGWHALDGNGLVTIASNGPDNSGPAFKTIARSHATNGPGQEIDISCLECGTTYRVTAKIFLEDGTGSPFACQRGSNWNTPYYCPIFSIGVDQPWGYTRWNFFNQNTDPIVAGWNEFESEFTVSSRIVNPHLAHAYFRGPAKDIVIYFNEVNVTLTSDPPENELVVPARDLSVNCTNYCCEMVRNGDSEV